MKEIFENFKKLKQDMEQKGWILDAFDFIYKQISYAVLVKLYLKGEKRPEYSLLKVEIIQINSQKNIEIPVNSNGFMIDTKTLREFFGIEYSENLGNLLAQFNANFARFIPDHVMEKRDELRSLMLTSLSKNDSENPNKKYCYTIKRNPKGSLRTPFNNNKTKI